jgi:NDP-sugar pyrophosphorylase family protein
VTINGPVVIGPKCHIEYGSSIDNAVLWENVYVGAITSINHSIIGKDIETGDRVSVANSVVTASQTAALSSQA